MSESWQDFVGRHLRQVYPLWLREKIYFHSSVKDRWPHHDAIETLAMVPLALRHLVKSDVMHRQIAWLGFYDLPLSKRICALAQRGGLLVDVGANIGYFSCLWAASRPENKVIAYEPAPAVFKMLDGNLRAAALESRVELHQIALSNRQGTMPFDLGPSEQSGWGGLASAADGQTIAVETARLDDRIDADQVIEVLKIDTEGADGWVLSGATGLLAARRVRTIFFEQNVNRMQALGIAPAEPFEILRRHGYRVRPLGRGADLFIARPPRP